MAESKKITELHSVPVISDDDEFIVVDKSTTSGEDASASGKTSKIRFSDLKTAVGSQGSVGEKGSQGPKGDTGTAGSPGPAGPPGPSGPQGSQGSQGPQGPQGAKGPQGNPGTSTNGVKGSKGDTGSTGDKGPQGNSIVGQTGDTGAKGPQGDKGPQGNSVTGAKGPQGNSITGAKGQKGQQGNSVTGPKGNTGASGSPWGGGTFSNSVYYNKNTYFYNSDEPSVYYGLYKSSNKNLKIDISSPAGVLSASGNQSKLATHRVEFDTSVEVNGGILAVAMKPGAGQQDRLSMSEAEWQTFRNQGLEGGQLILGYSGNESATGQIGTWNIDSCPIGAGDTDYDKRKYDIMRFFTYDLNNQVHIPAAVSPYGLTVSDCGTSNDEGAWDASKNRVLPQAALKVQGNGVYQIEFESRNRNNLTGHAMNGERVRGGIGIDTNGFMRIGGDGDETLLSGGTGGHYSGVGIMAFTKEVARFEQEKITFHVPVEYNATSGDGTSSNGIKTLQGWINDAIVVDDVAILMEQAGGANTGRHRISAWGVNTGMFLSHINPKDDVGFTGVGPGGTSLEPDTRPDLIMAETHLHDGTKKNKDEICFYAFTLHANDYNVRHTYRRSTKEITGINYLGVQNGGVAGHWKPFAAYATHDYDNNSNRMLIQNSGASSTAGSHNNDEHIQIYSCGLTGEGTQSYSLGTTRYLNIRDIDGFDDVLFWPGSTAANVVAYANVVSINPWNGRVYIVTGGECNAFHTFQINPAQKVSGKSWAETFWDACEASSSTADGYAYGDGHLQYVSSWKAPLQDTNRYTTLGANGDLEYSISYDYDTEKPKYIAHCSKYNEAVVTYSGHNVEFIPFSEDWM